MFYKILSNTVRATELKKKILSPSNAFGSRTESEMGKPVGYLLRVGIVHWTLDKASQARLPASPYGQMGSTFLFLDVWLTLSSFMPNERNSSKL